MLINKMETQSLLKIYYPSTTSFLLCAIYGKKNAADLRSAALTSNRLNNPNING